MQVGERGLGGYMRATYGCECFPGISFVRSSILIHFSRFLLNFSSKLRGILACGFGLRFLHVQRVVQFL